MNNKTYKFTQNPFRCAMVEFHPHTIKYVKKGHPWVTEDSFTKKFPQKAHFLKGTKEKSPTSFGVFLHDPTHPKVKARLWSYASPEMWGRSAFEEELLSRLIISIEKRIPNIKMSLETPAQEKRENYYLVFGESDSLPGLKIQVLSPGKILIQYYSNFWSHFQKELLAKLSYVIKRFFPEWKETGVDIFIQTRSQNKNIPLQKKSLSTFPQGDGKLSFISKEFEVNYQIHLGKSYDFGLYTDMSAYRNSIKKLITPETSVLNLFSYTGAFSLFALKLGSTDVQSVDLSPRYMKWLNHNISLNPTINASLHSSKVSSALDALGDYEENKKKFNLIICDPPSSSSDGNKRSKAINSYNQLLPSMLNVLEEKGRIILFLNTHNITFKKFFSEIESQFKIHHKSKTHKLQKLKSDNWDCPSKKGFPEGDYLKAVLISPL